jgi:hypothetical protein
MSDCVKNITTNIIGLILLGINVYCYYWHHDIELPAFLTMLCVSLALFMFKGTKTKEWLEKALSKFLSK